MKLKTLLIMLVAMLATGTVSAQSQYAGKMYEVGDVVTTLETGKQYFLFSNAGKNKFAYENGSNLMKLSDSPDGLAVEGNLGYMITLEESGTAGSYYLKTGNGNYIQNPSANSTETSATQNAMKVAAINGQAGHFNIGPFRKLNADAAGENVIGGTTTAANSVGDWSFKEVKMKSAGDLKGKALYDFMMSSDNIVRFNCKRAPSYYLTSEKSGSVSGATKKSTGFTQIWIKTKEGGGYTLRNANTGEYLQKDFNTTSSSKQILYIQYSPNNKNQASDAWANVSSEADFSGKSCMNMETNHTGITKWTYSGDEGCDWAMSVVDNVTEEQVRQHLNEYCGWASEIQDGKYYRIIAAPYGKQMTDGAGTLTTMNLDEENLIQCWTVRKSGEGYTIQNVVTDAYANGSSGRSQPYTTASTKKVWYVQDVGDKWYNLFTITSGKSDTQGMHCASSQGYQVVQWDINADASRWAFKEVSLTPEQIEKAREQQAEYESLLKNKTKYQNALANLYKDNACSELKDEIKNLSDEQLAQNADYASLPDRIKQMVLKEKNNTWQVYTNGSFSRGYEKFFRVADYKVYSNYSTMSWREQTGQSNAYGKLSNPTGIIANPGDVVLIYVDQAPNSNCTLQLEMVSTEGVPGNHQTGSCVTLQKGMNVVKVDDQRMLYVFYQLDNVGALLNKFPDIKIHIEGGQLQGYWDATRDMTNDDWKLLQKSLLKACPFINLKTRKLVHIVHGDELKRVCPDDIATTADVWNKVCENEEAYQGLEEFEGKFNNVWNVFTVDYNYMFATTYGTYYHWNTMSSIYDVYSMTHNAGSLWGPSHEMGHNHQSTFNMISCMEVSNNLFPNINVWEQGVSDTRGYNVESNFAHLPGNEPWLDRNIWSKTRLYFQLYLYFHAMHNNDRFYPEFFKALRKDPLYKAGDNSRGADDYLKFYKTACDVAKLDLTEFFESYGFFVPINHYVVEDYANYKVTTTQADIDAAKKYVANKNYPKAGNIMFINDKVEQKKAEPNPEWHAQTSSTYRAKYPNDNPSGWYQGRSKMGGDLEIYDGGSDYRITGDSYSLSGSNISFKLTGNSWCGHKFYDKETGRLIWATNKKDDTLPSQLSANKNWYVVAAEANGNDVPCPLRSMTSIPLSLKVTFADGLEKTWNVEKDGSTDLAKYLPENAVAVYEGTTELPESYAKLPNVIVKNADGNYTAEKLVINGDKSFKVPVEVFVEEVDFTKSGKSNEWTALKLPFQIYGAGLMKGEISGDVLNVVSATQIDANTPVILEGKADYISTNATIAAGTYGETENALILNAAGKQIVTGTATPFVYVFDKAYTVNNATGIDEIENANIKVNTNSQFNVAGQRVDDSYRGIVINGKKKILK